MKQSLSLLLRLPYHRFWSQVGKCVLVRHGEICAVVCCCPLEGPRPLGIVRLVSPHVMKFAAHFAARGEHTFSKSCSLEGPRPVDVAPLLPHHIMRLAAHFLHGEGAPTHRIILRLASRLVRELWQMVHDDSVRSFLDSYFAYGPHDFRQIPSGMLCRSALGIQMRTHTDARMFWCMGMLAGPSFSFLAEHLATARYSASVCR